ncbi:MAG: BatD family protein [Candidatus Latescibacter sp.]|nr:BatD family protein [Candidatus Latescibacter sp.]
MTGKLFNRMLCAIIVLTELAAGVASGATVTITPTVSANRISLSERLTLTLSITGPDVGKSGAPALKPMPDFSVGGPSTSVEYQWINGKTSTQKSYTYTLVPSKTGLFEVGAATVVVGGQTFTSNPIKVEVVTGSAAPQPSSKSGAVDAGGGDSNIFIRTTVDNRQPYVGQQVTLTFELYNRLTLWGDTEYDPPSTTGFWSVDLPKLTPSTRTMDNRIFQYTAVKTALFPTMSGELTIGPASLTYTAGGFFTAQQTRRLSTKPITVKVRPHPLEGKPDDFKGAVGDFKISALADRKELKAGDIVTVTVTVTGEGNLDVLPAVNTPDFSAFKTYDPKVTPKILNSGFTVGGAKIFEYMLMPKFPGVVTLQPFSLSFFNPRDKKYHTISTGAVTLRITPGETTSAGQSDKVDRRNAVVRIGSDINFIKPDKALLVNSNERLYANGFFYFFYIIPSGAFIAAFLVKRRRGILEQNRGLKRKLNAWKHAEKRLEHASRLLEKGETFGFCAHVSEAVIEFIGDRLNIDPGALTTGEMEDILRNHAVAPETAGHIRKTMELCDFARFSSAGADSQVQRRLLDDAKSILAALRETL